MKSYTMKTNVQYCVLVDLVASEKPMPYEYPSSLQSSYAGVSLGVSSRPSTFSQEQMILLIMGPADNVTVCIMWSNSEATQFPLTNRLLPAMLLSSSNIKARATWLFKRTQPSFVAS